MRSKYTFLFGLVFATFGCKAQISFEDTIADYSAKRMVINLKGLNVLTGWSAASVVSGGIGYSVAKTDEWKYFHEMNGIVGIINGGIATYGFLRTRKQLMTPLDMQKVWHTYRQDKKILLISIGTDVACMVAGAYLVSQGKEGMPDAAMNRGFGRSLIVQGVFLAALDNVMLAAHNKYSGRWATILDELRLSGTGFSYVHTF